MHIETTAMLTRDERERVVFENLLSVTLNIRRGGWRRSMNRLQNRWKEVARWNADTRFRSEQRENFSSLLLFRNEGDDSARRRFCNGSTALVFIQACLSNALCTGIQG